MISVDGSAGCGKSGGAKQNFNKAANTKPKRNQRDKTISTEINQAIITTRDLRIKGKMIALVQRVRSGKVEVEGKVVGCVGRGFVVLVGVCKGDEPSDAIKLADKIAGLRIFEDEAGKMNLSLLDVGGGVLAISQFTLCGDVTRGRRPSFDNALHPQKAKELFDAFVELLRAKGIHTEAGVFGARMLVTIENDGPVTIWIDSKAKRRK